MKRVALLVGNDLAVLVTLMMLVCLAGLDGWIKSRGLALGPLLGFAAVLGIGGAVLSLAMSRSMVLRCLIVAPRPFERGAPGPLPGALRAFGIRSTNRNWTGLLRNHPTFPQRIAALESLR